MDPINVGGTFSAAHQINLVLRACCASNYINETVPESSLSI
jgi:hypothetical protein